MHRRISVVLGAGVALTGSASVLGNVADSVADYTPGSFANLPAAYNGLTTASSALGPIAGDTGYGYALNPFNPPYDPSQIVAIGAGGQLTLHMASPVAAGTAALGVFSNSGLDDASGGSGVAFNPATTLDEDYGEGDPEAIVEVSPDDVNSDFVALNGGQPIVFTNPSNGYLDGEISDYYEPLGTEPTNQSEPFTGTLASFNGLDFDQIKTLLNGSAGGTWLDLTGTGYSSINYVRFVVPSDATYGMVVDSVSAVPEPGCGVVLVMGTIAMLRRKSRRSLT